MPGRPAESATQRFLHSDVCSDTLRILLEIEPSARYKVLTECGRDIHRATLRVVYHTVTLDDDDGLLLLFEHVHTKAVEAPATPLTILAQSTLVCGLVQQLIIQDSSNRSGVVLHTEAVAELLGRFPNLESIVWKASRAPPVGLGSIFAKLSHFSGLTIVPNVGSLSKWSGNVIPMLPKTLVDVHLSELASEGCRLLTATFPQLSMLQKLVLVDASSVDDDLMMALADNALHLKSLTLVRIIASKLSDTGMKYFMENAFVLQELNLYSFEGRLSTKCWANIDADCTPMLNAFRVTYDEETGCAHTWMLNHLASCGELLRKCPTLTTFWLERLHPNVNEGTTNRFIKQVELTQLSGDLHAAVLESGIALKELCLDMFHMTSDQVQSVFETCLDLTNFQLLVDAPFLKMLSETSGIFHPYLRRLVIASSSALGASPTITSQPLRWSTSSSPEQSSSAFFDATNEKSAAKEIKRFVKRGKPRLAVLESNGVGGLGRWTIRKSPTLQLIQANDNVEYGEVVQINLTTGLPCDLQELLDVLSIAPRKMTETPTSMEAVVKTEEDVAAEINSTPTKTSTRKRAVSISPKVVQTELPAPVVTPKKIEYAAPGRKGNSWGYSTRQRKTPDKKAQPNKPKTPKTPQNVKRNSDNASPQVIPSGLPHPLPSGHSGDEFPALVMTPRVRTNKGIGSKVAKSAR